MRLNDLLAALTGGLHVVRVQLRASYLACRIVDPLHRRVPPYSMLATLRIMPCARIDRLGRLVVLSSSSQEC